jgi:hypothetical protein
MRSGTMRPEQGHSRSCSSGCARSTTASIKALASRSSTAEQLPCGGSPLTVTQLRRVRFQVPMVADLGRVV